MVYMAFFFALFYTALSTKYNICSKIKLKHLFQNISNFFNTFQFIYFFTENIIYKKNYQHLQIFVTKYFFYERNQSA